MTPTGSSSDGTEAGVERRIARLADERGVLFEKASASFGLSAPDQHRLASIERELDECFGDRRRQRAERDAGRFDRDRPMIRRMPRRPAP